MPTTHAVAARLADQLKSLDPSWERIPWHALTRLAAVVGDSEVIYLDADLAGDWNGLRPTYTGRIIVLTPAAITVAVLDKAPVIEAGDFRRGFPKTSTVDVHARPWKIAKIAIAKGLEFGNADDQWDGVDDAWPADARLTLSFLGEEEDLTLPLRRWTKGSPVSKLPAVLAHASKVLADYP